MERVKVSEAIVPKPQKEVPGIDTPYYIPPDIFVLSRCSRLAILFTRNPAVIKFAIHEHFGLVGMVKKWTEVAVTILKMMPKRLRVRNPWDFFLLPYKSHCIGCLSSRQKV
jgi:hypothetical protein